MRKQVADAAEKELEAARQQKQTKLNELQKLLTAMPAYQSGAPLAEPTGEATEQQRLRYEADIAQRAIKTLVESNTQAQSMSHENSALKRKHSSIGAALSGFDNAPTAVAGLTNIPVNASANQLDGPASKRVAAENPMVSWRRDNPYADWRACNQYYMQHVRQPVAAHGTVHASALNGPWTPSVLHESDEATNLPECLCAQHLHPQLFAAIQDMSTGRIISDEDTGRMLAGVNRGQRR